MRFRQARFLFFFVLLFALGGSVGYAATITVDGTADDTLGNLSGNGTCDLREAVEAANTDTEVGECKAGSGADTIEFTSGLSGATIALTTTGNTDFGNSALAVDTDITVRWLGSDPSVTIARTGTDRRLFFVEATGSLTLQDLMLEDGVAQGGHGANRIAGGGGGGLGAGGAVFVNGGTLNVVRSTLMNNQALGGDGGDFASTAGQGGGGGSAVAGGSGSSGGAGSAAGAGAGGDGGSFTTAATCTGSGEDGGTDTPGIGAGGGGAGNCNTDPPSGNNAAGGGDGNFGGGGGGGGGLFCDGGGCGAGGAAGSGGYAGGNGGSGNVSISSSKGGGGGAGMGGAIFNNGGSVSITNSTLSGNSATGGAGGTGGASNGTAGRGLGGGVFNRNGTVTVLNSTINGNTVTTSGGGIFNLGDSAIATTNLNNTIVANSSGGIDFDAATIDGGTNSTGGVGNLIESSSGFSGTIKSSSDPKLAALADNGGPTQTHAFATASPAIDTGNNAAASSLTTDQRGFEPRVVNGTVDIGAVEDGALLLVNFSINDRTITESDSGIKNFTFTVTLDNNVSGGARVDYASADNTATTADGDYSAVSGTLTFAGTAGETETITMNVTGDTVVEFDESFFMILSNPSPATIGFTDSSGIANISNDDAALLSIDDVTLAEGDAGITSFTFTVTLDSDVESGFTVDYTTTAGSATDGVDYTGDSGTLNFVGSAGETQTVTVAVIGDTVLESDEDFTVDLSNIVAGGLDVTFADDTGLGTIGDDDTATLSIDDVTLIEGDAGTTAFLFTVTLDNDVEAGVTVDYTTTDGTATVAAADYVANSDTLTFVGTAGETQTITVDVNGDTVVELDENFSVDLSNVSGAVMLDPQGLGTISNDDAATLSIDDVTLAEGDSGTTSFVFTVTLDSDLDTGLSVDVTTTDGTATVANADYVANSDTLGFAGSAGETQTFTVNVNGDDVFESDEDFTVDLSSLAAAERDVTVSDPQGLGTISNDDVSKVQISVFEVSVSEDGVTDDYTVVLGEQPTDDVTVSFATDAQLDPVDPLTFTAADWDVPQPVTVSAVDDNDAEGEHSSVIVHSVSSSDPGFDGLDLGFLDVTATITDNDVELAFALGADSPIRPIPAIPGDSDVVVLQAVVSSSGAEVDVTIETATVGIDQIAVSRLSTAFHRVDALKLYQDVNEDGQVDDGDVPLGAGTSLDESTDTLLIVLDQPLIIAAGSAATVLFAYDFVDTSSGFGLPAGLLIALVFPFGLLLGRPRRRSLLLLGLLLSLVLAGCITQTIPPLQSVTYSSTLQQVTTDLDPDGPTLTGLPLAGADVSLKP